jgi:hypothetical protein
MNRSVFQVPGSGFVFGFAFQVPVQSSRFSVRGNELLTTNSEP